MVKGRFANRSILEMVNRPVSTDPSLAKITKFHLSAYNFVDESFVNEKDIGIGISVPVDQFHSTRIDNVCLHLEQYNMSLAQYLLLFFDIFYLLYII